MALILHSGCEYPGNLLLNPENKIAKQKYQLLYKIHHAFLKEKANYKNLKATTTVAGLEGSFLPESSRALRRKGNSELVRRSRAQGLPGRLETRTKSSTVVGQEQFLSDRLETSLEFSIL